MTAITLSVEEARRLRVLAQGLDGVSLIAPQDTASDAIAQIVRRTGGIQAQDMNTAPLQVRARSSGLTSAHVIRALSEERSIIRTWMMRGTLHLIPAEDQRWMTALFGPPAFSATRGRRLELGLDEPTLHKAVDRAAALLTGEGPLTRPQLAERLGAEGIPVEGQALHHILRAGGFLGVLCHGPLLDGRTETFVAVEDWLAGRKRPVLPRDEALAALARRYIHAFGPSTPRDFAVWAGLPLRDARAGWAAISHELVEVDAAGETAWAHREGVPPTLTLPHQGGGDSTGAPDTLTRPGAGILRLLGFFDTYLLGYRARGLAIAPEHLSRVNAGGGMIRPVVTIDGLGVATWSWTRLSGGRALEIEITPFSGLEDRLTSPWAQQAVQAEVHDIGRFLGLTASLRAD